ncbi:proton-coupled amino acid transporter-like protein CG1139 [Polistes fuscatus]|uniref:proton-coupled amino acid transporter-like protein CG1139 n=1 Tax=Polistes fuscatus TaxID=30207 RepID=UPI001CA959F1|nr:proton-coupled amino acid transporter-like protein CG1139 [Polistes fuscatus]XP_043498228.1 proton-coupled amino acid transporter-like protein CG1139 [Polistes fuscatus]XP_043498229.1 proton-coupled amino acid transporter-like protein CG1139 [Polistes fuscatus]XP_043498230.1 proton-coupled amino acid transporter-like protein CG1139 [Polistes fuscatus]XP_043498231.1 proton-coupled amino acid transporter-like protein CG1139 [Polistes fuscatus]XP_043498232.1 proton-coupled amino acid transport
MEKAKGETINMQLIDSQSPYKVNNELASSGLSTPDAPMSPTTHSEESYDPHKHRNVPNPTSNAETLIHLLKGSLGTGILAMPNAFCNSGLVTGVIATVIIGALCTYCLHVLVRAQYKLCKRLRVPILSYPMSMKCALEQGPRCVKWFSPYAPGLVDGFMIAYQLGICCVYIVFVAKNIKQVADQYWEPLDIQIHMFILLLPLILINYIRNLKLLAPFSTLANIITFIGLGMIIVYMFEDVPSISDRQMFGTVRNFALYFGTTLFALEAVGVIIALENNMKTPQYFGGYCGVLNIGMTVIVTLYILMGFFGYLKYGSSAGGSVTFNLPEDQVMAQSIKIMFAIAIFITYALQGYVPVDIIWNTYLNQRIQNRKILWEYVCRTLVTLATFTLAITVPRLGLFISLFGALCLSALGIAFPAIIEICALWPNELGPYKIFLIKDLALILFGLIGLVVGTYVSIVDIILSFSPDAGPQND